MTFRSLVLAMVLLTSSCHSFRLSAFTEELKTPDKWQNPYHHGSATFVDAEIQLISTKNWFLLTQKQYSDFVLEAEVLLPDVAEYSNSGILFRGGVITPVDGSSPYAFGYQAEVDPSLRKWSGGLYEQGTERKWLFPVHPERSKPGDKFMANLSPEWSDQKANAYRHLQWNRYRIQAVGSEIKIWVNDVLTTHVFDDNLKQGFIGIQHHGSESFTTNGDTKNTVRFRNIRIQDLSL